MTARLFALLLALPCFLAAPAFGKTTNAPHTLPAHTVPVRKVVAAEKPLSVIRVNVTNQPYDFLRPWTKSTPYQRRAVCPILEGPEGKMVLVTGEMVADATYVELEKPDSGEKTPASVIAVDYECNLALVKPVDARFLDGFKPLALGESRVGDNLSIWQLEGNGTLLSTRALVTSAEVLSYPVGDSAFLLYRLTSALQPREGSFTAPAVHGERLTGMVIRFDSRTQNADAIPAPVIAHFLKSAARHRIGFPQAGVNFSPLRDPQLRRYSGASGEKGGVYITNVLPESAAAKAGLQVGDVLTAIDGRPVDRDGNYADPLYGKVSLSHLISTLHDTGDQVPFQIVRKGDAMTLKLTLTHADPSKSVIEPYVIDRAPRYYILGGLIFQELSRQYLFRGWGASWTKKAPDRFVYLDRYQSEIFANDPRERVVILSYVLPSPCTLGYDNLSSLIVTEINGVKLRSLSDIEGALANSKDGFHRIRFSESPGEIVLDAAEVARSEATLMKDYGLPALKRLDIPDSPQPSNLPAPAAPEGAAPGDTAKAGNTAPRQ